MPSAVAKSKITEILQEATSLSAAQLDKLLPQIVALRLEKRKLVIPRRQSELLKSINRSLSPQKRRLYQRLQEKLRSGTLSESENNQLLKLSDELEWLGVARLRALIELAAIQKTTVPKLMKQMGIAPAAYASAA